MTEKPNRRKYRSAKRKGESILLNKPSTHKLIKEVIKQNGNRTKAYKTVFPDVLNDNVAGTRAWQVLNTPAVNDAFKNEMEKSLESLGFTMEDANSILIRKVKKEGVNSTKAISLLYDITQKKGTTNRTLKQSQSVNISIDSKQMLQLMKDAKTGQERGKDEHFHT